MKIFLKHITFLSFLFLFSCSNNERKAPTPSPCLPAYIIMVYIGENSAPTAPILFRTDEKDSTYRQYLGDSKEFHLKNDFTISEGLEKYYMRKFILTEKDYTEIKRYIAKHNTGKNNVKKAVDYSQLLPFKIILSDQCDSISYIVDNTDLGYFEGLLDLTATLGNEKPQSQLDYYRRMHER